MRIGKYLVVLAAVGFCAGSAAAGIAGTDHDFSGSGWSGGEICLPCHAPHNTDSAAGYLWNHDYQPSSAFTLHPDAELGHGSLICLGCHDGQTAIDSFGGNTGSTVISGDEALGTDLTDDHPVGIEYPYTPGGYNRYAAPGTIWGSHPAVGNLPLWDSSVGANRIECTTCHTPHSNSINPFLRVSNAGSGLCITCHDSW